MAYPAKPIEDYAGEDLEKVYCSELKVGMFVQELDRPWLETSFMFQGFCIRTGNEIEELQKYCNYVFINKSCESSDSNTTHHLVRNNQENDLQIKAIAGRASQIGRYADTVVVEKELKTAKKIYEESNAAVEEIFNTANSNGTLNLSDAAVATSGVVDSVMRNPDAFMLLIRLRQKASYSYMHAINCCALAATFCRHLGFGKPEILEVSLGALLLDIGITRVPDSLISIHGKLNPALMKLVRHHVQFGTEILDSTPNIPKTVKEMVHTHHERVNGEGYPYALKGDAIPVSGRIASIIDCYDAMISNRPYRKGMPPSSAIRTLYAWRGIDFNEDLVEQFIQCIGAYPTGSLVELSSGQVGIVLSQNRVRRLYPKILLILSADKKRYQRPTTMDMWEYAQQSRNGALEINRVIDADELGIDPADYYL